MTIGPASKSLLFTTAIRVFVLVVALMLLTAAPLFALQIVFCVTGTNIIGVFHEDVFHIKLNSPSPLESVKPQAVVKIHRAEENDRGSGACIVDFSEEAM